MIEQNPLQPTSVFHLFDEETRQGWMSRQTYTFKKGEQVTSPFDVADDIYLIVEGDVRIFHLHEDGKECVLGILTVGDFIDLARIFSNKESDTFTIALTPVSVVKVTKQEIVDEVTHNPKLSFALLQHFSDQLRDVVMILEQVAYDKVEERLWRTIIKLMEENQAQDGWCPLPPYLTHKDLAGMIASTRETVTFLLNKWMQKGIVRHENQRLWIKKTAQM
ncbi:Crp/Fnr family transcriptional regulator [Lentibacillus saliphilus]|uniref:Crp/Fnr family transcriptional regulator n=1 Tax=Lentibacillus saliphilus TaxID=2737028 RepID=UPI001C2FCE5D|nr:Crp/Fnr family transcriptional regulator [Lentibacillus saliphilus]